MSEVDGNADWPSFRIDLALTDADILTFQQIVLARQRRAGASRLGWTVVGSSFAIGLAGGWLMTEAGIVHASDAGLVSVVIFAVYWLAVWTASLASRRQSRRLLREGLADMRGRLRDATMLVSPQGIVVRLADSRGFYRRSAVKTATLQKDLLVLWAAPETGRAIVCVPVRLLQPDQQDRLMSLGRQSVAAE